MQKFLQKHLGFTLIEIMIVIAIIGVLSAALYPALGLYHGRARDTIRITDISRLRSALQIYHNEKDSYPSFAAPLTTNPFVTECISADVWTGTLGNALGNILNTASFPSDPLGGDTFCYRYSSASMYQAGGKTAAYYCPTFSVESNSYILKFNTELREISDRDYLLQIQSGSMSTYCVDDGTNKLTISGATLSGSLYSWTLTGMTACSVDCGGGTQAGVVVCSGPYGEVDSSFCTGTPPSSTQACNTFSCTQTASCGGSIPANASNNNGGSTTYTQNWNSGSLAYLPSSLNWFFNSISSECAFMCNLNYTWNGGSCVPDTRTVDCGGSIPSNATATTATGYTQAWDGGSWAPTMSWAENQATCDFNCDSGYSWSGATSSCVASVCTLPWGGTVANGANVTAYLEPSVPSPGTCASETRSCTTGVLSGTYINQSCSVTNYTYGWQSSSWGTCSYNCGGGTQYRSNWCQRSDSSIVSGTYCTISPPSVSQACNTSSCTSCIGMNDGNGYYCAASMPASYVGSSCVANGATWTRNYAGGQNCGTQVSVYYMHFTCSCSTTTRTYSNPGTPTNGVCGSANGSTSGVAPVSNLCNVGTATIVTPSGSNWLWSCNGISGGNNANCSSN